MTLAEVSCLMLKCFSIAQHLRYHCWTKLWSEKEDHPSGRKNKRHWRFGY